MDRCPGSYGWSGGRGGWLWRCHCCKTVSIVAYCYRCVRVIEDDSF